VVTVRSKHPKFLIVNLDSGKSVQFKGRRETAEVSDEDFNSSELQNLLTVKMLEVVGAAPKVVPVEKTVKKRKRTKPEAPAEPPKE